MRNTLFLEGPAGSGKTEYAINHLLELLESGVEPESILVLVPHPVLGNPYQIALANKAPWALGRVRVKTLSGLAREMLDLFWPAIASRSRFDPRREPVFLSLETAQYYMRRFVIQAVEQGIFDSLRVPIHRIAAQILDTMNKAAVAGFPFTQVPDRLIAAWGDRSSARINVYKYAGEVAKKYRAHCRNHNLLDFALLIETFTRELDRNPEFRRYLLGTARHLIADNVEEDTPAAHETIRKWLPHLETALLIMDRDAGYRAFLGADPISAETLRDECDHTKVQERSVGVNPDMEALAWSLGTAIMPDADLAPPETSGDPLSAFTFEFHDYYPQMLDWVADEVASLVHERNVPPSEIVIMAPYLGDALRFSLTERLSARGIPTITHRPSRAISDEPANRAVLTLTALIHPEWGYEPTEGEVAEALFQVIEGLDPVRANLLTNVVYRPGKSPPISEFEIIKPDMQERITYSAGERYDHLRSWLLEMAEQNMPLDHFLSRLFGEVLSQLGYKFHSDLDAGRAVAELIESARRFRQTVYPFESGNWDAAAMEYLTLIREGLLAALYPFSWRDELTDAVFIAPAYTFLMRNRSVRFQFWLDLGSESWWERLYQPLTHPYVLKRDYPPDRVWSDDDEANARTETLYKLALGLIRRCRERIYLGISDLGEQGFEQRGPLLLAFQRVLERNAT